MMPGTSVSEMSDATEPSPTYSFVIPVLDEIDSLPMLRERLTAVMAKMDGPCEVVLVDDGSTDRSFDAMAEIHAEDSRFRVVRLSRNFGHQIALTAGLDHAEGSAAIIMDADLQDPPEVAIEMAAKWREGFEVVYAVRDARDGESWFKRVTATRFYRLLSRLSEVEIPHDAGDFRLVDRRAIDAVVAMREHRRYLRGMFSWVGYEQTAVHYHRDARQAGETKFSLRKMVAFATDGVISFSSVPLRLILNFGFFIAFSAFTAAIVSAILKLANVYTVPGWASIVVAISLLGGLQLLMLGVIGEYVARIHEEVKHRPLYLVRDSLGVSMDRQPDRPKRG
ncbi:MAG: glycosyltransferase involved in cell wall biosynthesis [Candidatus Aldehydirespiratoraceae bacterium]|jgi:glycosyltransferase involved in cell wall biosynthesis